MNQMEYKPAYDLLRQAGFTASPGKVLVLSRAPESIQEQGVADDGSGTRLLRAKHRRRVC